MDNKNGVASAEATAKDVIEILHITDCHLSADTSNELLGVNTLDSLDAVLAQAVADQINPDLIMVTGDLAQDGTEEAYRCLQDRLTDYHCPKYWFAGNHDHRPSMQEAVGQGSELTKVVRIGRWQIIMLDSLVPGSVFGRLQQSELDVLEQTLKERPDLHTLVSLHHHPIDINSAWLDGIGLHNRDEFWQIIDRASNVKAVLWGHIHQDVDAMRGDVRLLASPSTCIQFKPGSDDFAIDNVAPGYRKLCLNADGELTTEVVRAESFDFTVDMESNGY
jgi:3',5'-cyclic-AMP phosphodiesterase